MRHELDLVVRLPSRRAMHLHRLGEVPGGSSKPVARERTARSSSTKAPRNRASTVWAADAAAVHLANRAP